jgi:hypothetical protein
MEWQPIETAPENTYILVWKPYLSEDERICLDRFKWVTHREDELVRERGNERTYRTVEKREREWESSGAEWWMPQPAPPPEEF